ncbi:hypothetical protein [Paracidovorax cattleyae]|uniref:hypothetical protein n=1 Tax=Paracidovorax cattleyae TaxID=80868 RepID=UPI0018AFBB8A|nr:hypothetical protein [Paracidovorax cattleyae]MBF9264621.1 hypothetical protein [Paracidovorax cattleyae]
MSFLQRFSFQDEKRMAVDLAGHLIKNLPPKTIRERIHTLSASRITRILEQAFSRLGQESKVGRSFLGRTMLANNFRWALKDAGYPREFIDIAVEGLIVEVSRRPAVPH